MNNSAETLAFSSLFFFLFVCLNFFFFSFSFVSHFSQLPNTSCSCLTACSLGQSPHSTSESWLWPGFLFLSIQIFKLIDGHLQHMSTIPNNSRHSAFSFLQTLMTIDLFLDVPTLTRNSLVYYLIIYNLKSVLCPCMFFEEQPRSYIFHPSYSM